MDDVEVRKAVGNNRVELNGEETALWAVKVRMPLRQGGWRQVTWTFRTEEKARLKFVDLMAQYAEWVPHLRPTVLLHKATLTWEEA